MSPVSLPVGLRSDTTGYDNPDVEDLDPADRTEIPSNSAPAKRPPGSRVEKEPEVTLDGCNEVNSSTKKEQPNEAYKANSSGRSINRKQVSIFATSEAKEFVIDVFRGRIVGIEGEVATVHLTGDDGSEFHGNRLWADFKGICTSVGDYFSCKTVNVGGEVKTVIGPPVQYHISAGELAKLKAELNGVYSE